MSENQNNQGTLTYTDKEIEEVLNILNRLGSTYLILEGRTLENASYINRIFSILNSQIVKRQQQNQQNIK